MQLLELTAFLVIIRIREFNIQIGNTTSCSNEQHIKIHVIRNIFRQMRTIYEQRIQRYYGVILKKKKSYTFCVEPNYYRTSIPKFHVLLLHFHLSQGLRKFGVCFPKMSTIFIFLNFLFLKDAPETKFVL